MGDQRLHPGTPVSQAPTLRPVPVPVSAASARPVPVAASQAAVLPADVPRAKGAIAALMRYCMFSELEIVEFRLWFRDNVAWYLISGLLHAVLLMVFVLIPLSLRQHDEAPAIEMVPIDTTVKDEVDQFEVGAAPLDPTELTTETLTLTDPPAQSAKFYDEQEKFEDAGGGSAVDSALLLGGLGGEVPRGEGFNNGGQGGVGGSVEEGDSPGNGGRGDAFGGRGQGMREEMIGRFGGTKASERAVAAGLNWIYRHQSEAGNWSLHDFPHRCKGPACTSTGMVDADSAATALALLPFLAAGQTHKSPGPYQKTIGRGMTWLVKHQGADGDLSFGPEQRMYKHGLAAITLCEAFGLTRDKAIGDAAQKAINFIQNSQNRTTGGWRYQPGDEGDTSVLGWQIMALKSAQMAGLEVDPTVLEKAKQYLKTVARGRNGGMYAYQSFQPATPTMTAVGMLSAQYLGAGREDPGMREGRAYLMTHLPDNMFLRNTYYWYYATQVMHNFLGPEWDTWNRHTRRILIESQVKTGCATGSWDPEKPSPDAYGPQGGRLCTTSLAVLSLEIYYRYLPLYKVESGSPAGPKPAPTTAQANPAPTAAN